MGYDLTLKVMTTNLEDALENPGSTIFNAYPVEDMYIKMAFIDSLRILAISLNGKSPYNIEKLDLTSGKRLNEFWEFNKIPDDT